MIDKFWLAALLLVLPAVTRGQTARDYFKEMKNANAFNKYADEYVCFADDDIPSFAIIGRVSDMIEHGKKNGDDMKDLEPVKRGLFAQAYYKGVSSGEGQIFEATSTAGEYSLEFRKPFHGKATYTINWTTGRYRYQIFNLNHSSYSSASERAGKCELIHPGVS